MYQYPTSQDLFQAAAAGNLHDIRKLLAHRINVNSADQNGMTPLILAAFKGHREAVEILLVGGADVTAQTHFGMTALKAATAKGNRAIVNLLQVYSRLQQSAG